MFRIGDFEGQGVLVTGASTGIGAAVAKAFARNRARVVVHCNSSPSAASAVVDEINAAGGLAILERADLGDPAQAGPMVELRGNGRHTAHRRNEFDQSQP